MQARKPIIFMLMLLVAAYTLYIEEEKLTHYLLNLAHPDGGSKARFFQLHGFKHPNDLRQSLLQLVQEHPVTSSVSTPFGYKYIVDGNLVTPTVRQVLLRSVWIVLSGSDICTFVTAYPL